MKSFTVSTRLMVSFRRRLFAWYRRHGRNLPWRKTRDPYAIMIAEIMLQQTQVDRVIQRYQQWLRQFPTVQTLARTSISVVLHAWSGLGYNRRALAVHQIAKTVTRDFAGQFPATPAALRQFKGIGQYTAHAISIFAFEKNVPLVDTNIKRVLGRIFFGHQQLARWRNTTEPFWELSRLITNHGGQAYTLNQAIMDFGATTCLAKMPRCVQCPMRAICKSYPDIVHASAETLRVKPKRTEPLYFGYPRRIWRGRILRHLHSQPRPMTTIQLGKALQTDWTNDRQPWLKAIVEQLAAEGLVQIDHRRIHV